MEVARRESLYPTPGFSGRSVASRGSSRALPGGSAAGSRPERPSNVSATPTRARRLIILPALDEELGLPATLDQLRKVRFGSGPAAPTVLVVDGHSVDRTVEKAQEAGVEVLVQRGRGKGAAIREAIEWAGRQGFDHLAVADADGTYPCEHLPALFALLDLQWDLVIGVRRPDPELHPTARDWVHRLGNHLLNYCAAQLSRSPLLDVCSGFWGVRRPALEDLPLRSDGFEIESELFVKAFRNRLRVAQFPIPYHRRIGSAKLRAARDGARILASILRNSRGSRRGPARGPRPDLPLQLPPASLLSSLLITLEPERVRLVAAPERRREAESIVARLAVACPRAVIETVPGARRLFATSGASMVVRETTIGTGLDPAIVVQLPPISRQGGAGTSALIALPRTERLLHVPTLVSPLPGEPSRQPVEGFQLEEPASNWPAVRAIFNASLDTTRGQQELAFLRANTAGDRVSVFRRAESPPWGTFSRGLYRRRHSNSGEILRWG
jgi:dolichol-phosphate hexosyltransferase